VILAAKIAAVVAVIGAIGTAIAAAVAQSSGITLSAEMLIPLLTSVVLIAVAWGVFKNKMENHHERISRIEQRSDGMAVFEERMKNMEERFEDWMRRLEREFSDWRKHQSRRPSRELPSDPEDD
jgi:membrane protein implicated in regulation of membrane protease activity